ncbi:MAG: glutamine-hydrolyzing GMP synthase [Nitrospinaceae bacterium]|nr:glutamine-hydrolyzing GMP synthase [Nitrospinaceae bacterium]NIR57593.1 glutamine-hydrolyzing GMP synthase [Nitrospinaceae bacterium]NIS88063.1 glutamine-hydrolyzing GMP synthase [Nitrospinaceae bacterium]NIT84927.1 glutamine-hydrolyzing GMP synthase [Nitrospinaceae bacterium]NIU47103.1 glutamine-hydrolyzing GMP synthase [Nitrospinaceae bacterium]
MAETKDIHAQKILILDFGSQYTQNIARKVRECEVYCEILPCTVDMKTIKGFGARGIILSGGPASVLEDDSPLVDPKLFRLGIPILGICYGMQLITHLMNGKVDPAREREYGRAELMIKVFSHLFHGVHSSSVVWMSHGDRIASLPQGFKVTAFTDNSPVAAMENPIDKIYGLQFHPEVVHTQEGKKVLQNFLYRICGCQPLWKVESFADYAIHTIQQQVNGGNVLCALSGGVDSSVVALLLHKAIQDRLLCIFIDNGLLRSGERQKVEETFREHFHMNLKVVDAGERFLERLRGVTDPEQKRKIIGNTFIHVFEEEAKKAGDFKFLAQGTLYPDVIESVSFKGPSAVIKSHHNVGGLPENMKMELVEPLRELFKDEVRALGRELGMPDEIISRQPFPGPGLAIRIIEEVTPERITMVQEADKIILDEIKAAGLYKEIWQSFAVLLPVKTVGVMGDARTYENVVALRAVTSTDGMTADWVHLPYELLGKISNRIINEVQGVNRVVYDISSKPPGTIEWE